jgi:N-acetyl-anhydromuramyl-L-alanine amidase AmpD
LNITKQYLEKGEYYEEINQKNTIYLHHTAGGHRPDWVISTWDTDDEVDKTGNKTSRSVATAYVIGGISTRNPKENSFDGKVYCAFDDRYWAHHLGTTLSNNRQLNKQSIGIEICNYGPLIKGVDGMFYTYVNNVVPEDQVVTLDKPFRGYKYYHAYTDNQIQAVKDLILTLKSKYPKIELKTPLLTVEGFELDNNATKGIAGIYSHSNCRNDKFDISPQEKMIKMLNTICQSK